MVAETAWDVMQKRFYEWVEKIRTDNRTVEVILVGGGAGLVDAQRLSLALGGCPVVRPQYACVTNSCGSALAQGVGEADTIADLSSGNRESVLTKLKDKARTLAGPSAQVIAYLPGNMTRVLCVQWRHSICPSK